MAKTDPRIDAYIAKAPEFAHPILQHLRAVVRKACPDVQESIKWSTPHFLYSDQLMCSMAAFKQHCTFGFWREKELFGDDPDKTAMGQFGRITVLEDLPADRSISSLIKQAMKLNDSGIKPARATTKSKTVLVVPDDLKAALKKNKKAATTFDGFSYSNQKEYVEWIVEAKREETRLKRLETTIEWLAEGKVRNWKYINC
jgi:uncharacterized protein YdeI (YjbR/CyaY-like superfamily)